MTAKEIIDGLSEKKKFPNFRVGDEVRVHVRIREGEKERIQVFEGVVIKKRRGGSGASFTVRKVSYGVGVERVFPFECPVVDKIEVVHLGKVRRARLFYLRDKTGKESQVDRLEDGSKRESDLKAVEEAEQAEKAKDEKEKSDSNVQNSGAEVSTLAASSSS